MSILSRIFEKQITQMVADAMKTQGSSFYDAMLKYIQNQPIYIGDNIDSYIENGYLFNPIVYSIVSFIAQKAGTIPWAVYDIKSEKSLKLYKSASSDLPQWKREAVKHKALEEIDNHPLNNIFKSPNVLQAWAEFIEQVIGFKLVTGNAYIHCIGPENGVNAGAIMEMWTLPSQAVIIVAGDMMDPIKEYQMIGYQDTVKIPPSQVIHLKYWTPRYQSGQFLYGISPIQAGRRVISKSNSSFDSMVASFQNMGARGILSGDAKVEDQTLTPEQAEMIENTWRKKFGTKNAGMPLITSAALKWQQTGMSPVDLAIIESDKMDLRTICNLYHVPSELFNDAANKTYSNTKEAGSAVYTNAVIPALTQFRDSLNQKIALTYPDAYIDFDTSMISELQDDLQGMTTALSGAWWLSPNERRSVMSFDEDTENELMDEYWVPPGLNQLGSTPAQPDQTVNDIALTEAAKALGLNDYVY